MKKPHALALICVRAAFVCATALCADAPATATSGTAASAPSYHASMLKLLGNDDIVSVKRGNADADTLKTKKYIFVYQASRLNPLSREFTPKLVDFYKKNHAANDDFEVIFVS